MGFRASKTATSSSGVATIDVSGLNSSDIQVTIYGVDTGNGIATITLAPSGTGGEYGPVSTGTTDLSDADAVRTFRFEGFAIDGVKVTSDDSGDVFSVVVGVPESALT